jgi:hypothetical protein
VKHSPAAARRSARQATRIARHASLPHAMRGQGVSSRGWAGGAAAASAALTGLRWPRCCCGGWHTRRSGWRRTGPADPGPTVWQPAARTGWLATCAAAAANEPPQPGVTCITIWRLGGARGAGRGQQSTACAARSNSGAPTPVGRVLTSGAQLHGMASPIRESASRARIPPGESQRLGTQRALALMTLARRCLRGGSGPSSPVSACCGAQ